MLRVFSTIFMALAITGAAHAQGLVVKQAHGSVAETVDKFTAAVEGAGAKVFAVVDHAKGAMSVGAEIPPATVVIFGNPKLGTPLMTSAQTTAIDLPQKALAYEDENGKVHLAYNDPGYLVARHGIEDRDEVLNKIRGALGKFTDAATK